MFSQKKKLTDIVLNGKPLNIIKKLGAGNRGMVFLAQDQSGQNICIKKESSKARAEKEATIIHKYYQHRSEVKENAGNYYFTLPYFEGRTLKEQKKLGLSFYEKLIIAKKLKAVLEKLHDLGYLHRDLKADNVMVNINSHGKIDVHLIDFGRSTSRSSSNLTLTTNKFSLFFQSQVAPEYLYSHDIGKHSDIYSFGKIFGALFPENRDLTAMLIDKEKKYTRKVYFKKIDEHLAALFEAKKVKLINDCEAQIKIIKKSSDPMAYKSSHAVCLLRNAVRKTDYKDRESILALQRVFQRTKTLVEILRRQEKPSTFWEKFKNLFNLFGVNSPLLKNLFSEKNKNFFQESTQYKNKEVPMKIMPRRKAWT